MINLYNQVPTVYNNASRDFQYLSWLINIVLNAVKHNVDDIYNLPHVGYDPKLSELLALTLGFKLKRNYDQQQLAALVEILPSILKYKGTKKAVEMAAESLITASGSLGSTSCEVSGAHLEVVLPEDLSVDITLFIDLLDYILPAGMTCRVIRENRTERTLNPVEVGYYDTPRYDIVDDVSFDSNNLSTGLAALFNIDDSVPEFTANLKPVPGTDKYSLNAGLLANKVIPVLSNEEVFSDNTVMLLSTETDGSNKALYAGNVTLRAKKGKQEY